MGSGAGEGAGGGRPGGRPVREFARPEDGVPLANRGASHTPAGSRAFSGSAFGPLAGDARENKMTHRVVNN